MYNAQTVLNIRTGDSRMSPFALPRLLFGGQERDQRLTKPLLVVIVDWGFPLWDAVIEVEERHVLSRRPKTHDTGFRVQFVPADMTDLLRHGNAPFDDDPSHPHAQIAQWGCGHPATANGAGHLNAPSSIQLFLGYGVRGTGLLTDPFGFFHHHYDLVPFPWGPFRRVDTSLQTFHKNL